MLRSRFLWKLYAGYALVILLSSGFVGGLVAKRVESKTLDETDTRLGAVAAVARDLVWEQFKADGDWQLEDTELFKEGSSILTLQERLHRVGAEIQIRLTVVRRDGVVLADSEKDPGRMENHADRPEIIEAYESGSGRSTRFSKTLGRVLRYYAVPLTLNAADADQVAVVRASLPLTALEDHLEDLRRAVFLGALASTMAALFVGFLYARRVTRPILSMAQASQEIAAGDYEQRVDSPGRDELGTLARAFNTMSRELRGSIASMEADRTKLSAILSSMVEGVVAVDRDERVVHINAVAAQLLTVTSENVLSRPIWEIARLHEASELLGEVLSEAKNAQRELRMPGSPERVVELRASPLMSEGRLSGAVLILEDVTQLRHLETMRQDFVGNVSHELKTPVTVIRGMIETMIDDAEMEPAMRERFLSRALLQAERMGDLVTDLLSLSHIESAPSLADMRPLDLRDSISRSVRTLQPLADGHSVTIVEKVPSEPVYALGEEEFLVQAVTNLLNNAIKYSPDNQFVEVRLSAHDNQALIEVEDQGAGIEAVHQERLFERFYRVDRARSRELGGTGLGLAIVKHIALSMGGEVSVDSTPGQGSTFKICLPRYVRSSAEIDV